MPAHAPLPCCCPRRRCPAALGRLRLAAHRNLLVRNRNVWNNLATQLTSASPRPLPYRSKSNLSELFKELKEGISLCRWLDRWLRSVWYLGQLKTKCEVFSKAKPQLHSGDCTLPLFIENRWPFRADILSRSLVWRVLPSLLPRAKIFGGFGLASLWVMALRKDFTERRVRVSSGSWFHFLIVLGMNEAL